MVKIARTVETVSPSCDEDESVRRAWREVPICFDEWTVRVGKVRCSLHPDWRKLIGWAESAWSEGLTFWGKDERIWGGYFESKGLSEEALSAIESADGYDGSISYELKIAKDNVPDELLSRVASVLEWRFNNDVFLALNLACPGSCDLITQDCNLYGTAFARAQAGAERLGWPFVSDFPLSISSDWLEAQDIRSADASGRHSGPKSLYALLKLCRAEMHRHETLLWSIIALESLFRVPKDKNGYRTSAECILATGVDRFGDPGPETRDRARSLLQKLYASRAGLLHTIGTVYRPWPYGPTAQRDDELYFALALVLADLQQRAQRVA